MVRSTGTLPAYSTFTTVDTYATGSIPHASSTDTLTALAIGTVGKVVRSTGTLPAYSTFTIPDTFAQGDLIYGSATNVLTALAKDANATRYLSNTGASNNPAWAQVDLTNGVTGDLPFANLAQGDALSVLGVTGNATADNASIAAGTDHQTLRRSGTALAFGALNLAQSAAVTGTLAYGNGGTGATSFTAGRVVITGASALADDADLTFATDTLTSTEVSTTHVTYTASANNKAVSNKILYGATTDAATAVELTTDGAAGSGSTNRIAIPTDAALSIVLNIGVKQSASANAKQMLRQVVISNNGGTTAIQGSVVALGTDSGSAGLATVTTTITANDTDDCLKVEVNGVVGTNLRYTCYVVSAETTYA